MSREAQDSHQLGATYDRSGAHFSALGAASFSVGRASIGRRGNVSLSVAASVTHRTDGSTLGRGALTETFAPVSSGIEEKFRVAYKMTGSGPLEVKVPVSGLTAVGSGQVVQLQGSKGRIVATYTGLKVFDAEHKVIHASMSAAPGGHAIFISVDDVHAAYPLTIDPTWSASAYEVYSVSRSTVYPINPSTGTVGSSMGGSANLFDDAAVTPNGQTAYVTDYNEQDVTPFNLLTDTVESAITGIGLYPVSVVTAPDNEMAYTINEYGVGSSICPITVATNTKGTCAAFPVVGGPMAITPDGSTLYVYTYSYGAKLYPVSTSTLSVGSPISVPGTSGPTAIAITPNGQTAYLLSNSGNSVIPVNLATGTVGSPISWVSGAYPEAIAITPNGQTAYVANSGNETVTPINLATNTAGTAISLSGLPGDAGYISRSIAIAPDGLTAYVSGFYGDVIPIDLATGTVGTPISTGGVCCVFVSPDQFVNPQGSALGADTWGGGSPSEPCQACSVPSASAQKTKGDPVNTATGDFSETSTDLSIPGAGVPLDFTRTYDAQAAQAEVTDGAPAPPLGYGWSDNLGMQVSYNSSTQIATVTEENGAQTTFNEYVSGSSNPWCSGSTNFCASAPRIEATLNRNTGGTWTYVRSSGTGSPTTFTFSSFGVLISVADEAGDTLSAASYSAGSGQTACPSGDTCQAWTSSASGRELVVATNGSGQLAEVFDANSTLAATFAYSGTGCSSWSGSETPDLCSVDDPGGIASSYTYDSSNSSSDFVYDMLTETPPGASGTTTNVYNSSGLITQQTDPAGEVTTFAYSGTNSSVAGGYTTITTYPDGTGSGEPQDVTIDQYSANVLIAETTGYGAAAVSTTTITRDPVSLLPLSVTDGDGHSTSSTYQTYSNTGGTPVSSANLLSSADALGNTTQNAYNAYNQAWCTVDAAETAHGVTCPTSPPSAPPSPGASDPDLGAVINFYNSSDQLTATTDALGNTTTYTYTSGVSGVPNGLMYCSVDPVDYQKSVSCPAYGASHVAGTATHTFDSAGDNLTSTDANGNTTTYVYGVSGHPGLVSHSTDPDGTVTSYTYNGEGQATLQAVTFGSYSATTQYAYDSYGRRYCETDPNVYAIGIRCPTSPPSASSPPTAVTSTFYDADGRVIQTTNPLGGTSITAYDSAGNGYCTVAAAQFASGTRCPSSEPSSPPTVGSDPYLGATITTYDADNQVIQVTNSLGGITLTAYDGAGNVASTTVESNSSTSDPNIVTSYTYDADNRVSSTTVGAGTSSATTTSEFYDPNGNVYCSVSANAYAAGSSSYQCPVWQAAWIAAAPSPSALYSSTPTASQANNVTTTFYDANGDQVQTSNPDVETTVSAVDGDGRTYCTSDPTNVASWLSGHSGGTYPYLCPSAPPSTPPSLGSNPDYTTTIFDAAGRTLSSTDQVGDTTSYTYAPGGQTLTTTDPRGKVSTNCYYYENGSGQCANGAPSAGGSGDNLYDSNTPGTGSNFWGDLTSYSYYPGGQTATITTMAGTAADGVDANGDLTGVTYSNTGNGYSTPANVAYTFNVDGTRHTMTDATGTTTYSYDADGDVTSQALVASSGNGLANAATSYGYYTTGVLASVTYPSYSGHANPQVTYAYDSTGAMASDSDWLGNEVTFAHDTDGNTTAQDNNVSGTNPSGTSSTALSYDAADENTGATSTINQSCGGSETLSQGFSGTSGSRNPDGQLTQFETAYSATCSGQTSSETNYSYDPAGRVTYQGSTPQGSSANDFAYDASGDPTTISSQASGGGSLDTYTQSFDNAGEVTSQSPVSGSGGSATNYSYDTVGDQSQSVTGQAATNYGYNQADQMASAATPTGSASYLYTGDGLEAASTASSANTVWSSPTVVDSTRAIDAETCTSASFCVAVDTTGYATIYNGSSWSTPTAMDYGSTALSCVSSSFCVAVGDYGISSVYTGTWSLSQPDSTRTINAVSCTSSTFCVAVDASGYATIYNGSSWSTPSDIDGSRSIDAVSCTSSSSCVAVDTSGYATIYNGSSWSTPSDVDSTSALYAVTCVSSSFCVAAGAAGSETTYNGSSWSAPSDIDASRTINNVVCPTSTDCQTVDTSGYSVSYNGSSWSTPSDIDGSNALEALSCSSASVCDASDNNGNVLTYNGSTWSSAQSIDAGRSLNAISCPSTGFCAAAGASGNAVIYAPSSQGWSTPSDVNSTRAINATSCVSSTFCVAVGASGYATIFNGSTWSTPSDVDSTRTLDAVSCVSSSFCVAVDTGGYATTYNGSTWSTPTAIDFGSNAVTCTSSTFCVVVGGYGLAAVYTGSWSVSTVDSGRTLDAVSCSSSAFCETVDTSGYGVKYTGSWGSPVDIDSSRSLDTVSCVGGFFCAAGGASGYVTLYSAFGGSWTTPSDVDSSRTIKAVSCTTFSQCVAVDSSGYATNYNGSSWSSAIDIDGSNSFESLTCANALVCTASDNNGNIVTYSGSSWSNPVNIDSTRSVNAVACPSTAFCVATDGSGYASVYGPLSASASQLTWDTNGSLPMVLSDSANDYIYGPQGSPVEQVSLASSTPTYLTYTSSDDTWISTNETGDETGFWGYDAYGNLGFGSPSSAFGYSGQYTDATTSLVNDDDRWYQAQAGGFMTRDPDFSATDSAYSYADDDPVNGSDPSGLSPIKLGTIVSGQAFGYYFAFNQISPGRGQSMKPGMVRVQFEFKAQSAAPVTSQMFAGIRNSTLNESGYDQTLNVQAQAVAHPSIPAYPGDHIEAAGVAVQFDGTQTIVLGTGIAPNVKFKIRGSRPPGLTAFNSSTACSTSSGAATSTASIRQPNSIV